MFSCAVRSTFFFGAMLAVVVRADFIKAGWECSNLTEWAGAKSFGLDARTAACFSRLRSDPSLHLLPLPHEQHRTSMKILDFET